MFCLYVILIKYTFKIQSIVKGSFPLIFFEVGFPSLVCADDSYSFTFEKDFLLVVGFERCGTAQDAGGIQDSVCGDIFAEFAGTEGVAYLAGVFRFLTEQGNLTVGGDGTVWDALADDGGAFIEVHSESSFL